jgi:hypothetical protein
MMLKLAEDDLEFREQVVNLFAFGEMPSKTFIQKLYD